MEIPAASIAPEYPSLSNRVQSTFIDLAGNIRVRSAADNSRRINFFQALLRYILKFTLGRISFLTMHMNPRRRAIQDLAAGSLMIKL